MITEIEPGQTKAGITNTGTTKIYTSRHEQLKGKGVWALRWIAFCQRRKIQWLKFVVALRRH